MLVLALLAAVVVLDQAVKWWAWRHVWWTGINSGGDVLVGPTISAWYVDPATGALLDLLDFGLLSIAVSVLVRRRAPAAIGVPGALMTGGWGSNLLDRLGVHYWTAPGSVRGVVDFIHIGGQYYNVADVFIIGCTPLFLLAAGYLGVRAASRPIAARSTPRPAPSRARPWVRIPALAGAGMILVVALGAATYGGVNAAARTTTRKATDMHARSRQYRPAHPDRNQLCATRMPRSGRFHQHEQLTPEPCAPVGSLPGNFGHTGDKIRPARLNLEYTPLRGCRDGPARRPGMSHWRVLAGLPVRHADGEECDRWMSSYGWRSASRSTAAICGRWPTGCSARSPKQTTLSRTPG